MGKVSYFLSMASMASVAGWLVGWLASWLVG